MTETPPEDPLAPERLAEAPLIIVAYPDGSAHLSLADHLVDADVADWLRTVADDIAAGTHREGCQTCASGLPHDHDRQE